DRGDRRIDYGPVAQVTIDREAARAELIARVGDRLPDFHVIARLNGDDRIDGQRIDRVHGDPPGRIDRGEDHLPVAGFLGDELLLVGEGRGVGGLLDRTRVGELDRAIAGEDLVLRSVGRGVDGDRLAGDDVELFARPALIDPDLG